MEMLWLPRETHLMKEQVVNSATYGHRECVGEGEGLWWGKDGAVSDFVVRWNLFIANDRNPAN